MAIDTLRREEADPASYPDAPSGLSTAAAALDACMIWARIESYIAWRWTPRAVVWTLRGRGEWRPDLTPTVISTVERWVNLAWETASLDASPLGGHTLAGGTYRIAGEAGGHSPADVPELVNEAFRRLAEYSAEAVEQHGAGRYEVDVGPPKESYDRNPAWRARALQLSGAADLLRRFRRSP